MSRLKRHYLDYPDFFIQVASGGEETLEVSLPYREAVAARHAFYRFIGALKLAMNEGDHYAKDLHRRAKNISVSLSPPRVEDKESSVTMVFNTSFLTSTSSISTLGSPFGSTPQKEEDNDIIPLDPDELDRIIAERKMGPKP